MSNISNQGMAKILANLPEHPSEIELLQKHIKLLDADIETDTAILDIVAGRLESNRQQKQRALKRIEDLILQDARDFPTFIDLEIVYEPQNTNR